MADKTDLDGRIKQLAQDFSTDEIILAGGLAVYLETGIYRDTDDADVIARPTEDIGAKIFQFQLKTGTRVDHTFPDNVFDSLNLSDEDLQDRAVKIKEYASGERISYLGAEALIVNKLTSFCISSDPNQPTDYGHKVLRDKDLDDVQNLLRTDVEKKLVIDLLETVPQLEEVPVDTFYTFALRVLSEPNAPISFTKNAFGVARYLATHEVDNKEERYKELLEDSREHQTPNFATRLNKLFVDRYTE